MILFKLKKLIKKRWGILHEALNRNKQNIDLPSEFIYENKTITDRVEIANSFNDYFINIGPNLSEKIDPSVNSTTTYKSCFTEPTNSITIYYNLRKYLNWKL